MTIVSDHRTILTISKLSSAHLPDSLKTIAAGEFKARCLKLLDEVQDSGEPLLITKFGKPVAQLISVPSPSVRPLFGAMKGTVLWEGDIVSPVMDEWDAVR